MKTALVLLSLLAFLRVKGQHPITSDPLAISSNTDQFIDPELLTQEEFEALTDQLGSSINLNTVNPEELRNLPFLTEGQVLAFFDYRSLVSKLYSFSELYAIRDWDSLTVRMTLPFVHLGESNLSENSLALRHLAIVRYKRTAQPFEAPIDDSARIISGHQGNRLVRYKLAIGSNYTLGYTGELDAGEAFTISQKQAGFDHTAAYVEARNSFGFDQLILGNFQLSAGQGLLFAGGGFSRKGQQAVGGVQQFSRGLRPTASAMEFGNYKGLAVKKKLGAVQATLFYSTQLEDGLRSKTGMHRTESEQDTRKTFRQQWLGSQVKWVVRDQFSIGLNTLWNGSTPSNNGLNTSLEWNWVGRHSQAFGEFAVDGARRVGLLTGFGVHISESLKGILVARKYSDSLNLLQGNGFGENSLNSNEEGLYLGMEFSLSPSIKAEGYLDFFRFPEAQFRAFQSSNGFERMARLTYKPDYSVFGFIQVKSEQKELNLSRESLEGAFQEMDYRDRLQYIFSYRWGIGTGFQQTIRGQVQAQSHGQENSKGGAAYYETVFQRDRSSLTFRFTGFDTPAGYPIYLYERDVLYSFSVPVLSGTGTRLAIVYNLKLGRTLNLQGKLSHTSYSGKEHLGNYPTRIIGNQKTDFTIQLIARW